MVQWSEGENHLVSTMSEDMDEIRPFRDQEFSFNILQHGGGKFKTSVVLLYLHHFSGQPVL